MDNGEVGIRFPNHVWDGFQYVVHSRKDDVTYFVCKYHKSGRCPARGILKNEEFKLRNRHTHVPNFREIKEKEFKRDLYRAVTTKTASYREIYNEVRTSHPEAAVSTTFVSCESSMYKWRQRSFPPVPASLASYVLTLNSNQWKNWKEYKGGRFHVSAITDENLSTSVLYIDLQFTHLVFKNGIVFADATFKIVPAFVGAYQFLTLMGVTHGHVIPFAWVLMQNKTTSAYAAVFREIKRLIPGFQITEAMSDYEKALQGALRQEFPGVIVHGCLFHYDQALFKNYQSLGLREQGYECQHMLSIMMVLPLLPANEIRATYIAIRDSLSDATKAVMQPFFHYYEAEWLAVVTPEVFSVYRLPRRTNNDLEAYHRTLNQRFGKHPNIWVFTKKLVGLQEGIRIDLNSIVQGYPVSRLPKFINVIKETMLFDAWARLDQPGGLTPQEFLEEAVRIFKNPVDTYIAASMDD